MSRNKSILLTTGIVLVVTIISLVLYKKYSSETKTTTSTKKSTQSTPVVSPTNPPSMQAPSSMGGALTAYGGRPSLNEPKPLTIPGDPIYGGFGGINMGKFKSPVDDVYGNYFPMDDAYTGLTVKQIARDPTSYKTTLKDNQTLKYGVVKPPTEDTPFGFVGIDIPYQGNVDRLVGVM